MNYFQRKLKGVDKVTRTRYDEVKEETNELCREVTTYYHKGDKIIKITKEREYISLSKEPHKVY